ncbi:hypothetical protein N0V87_006843 [Didymella glomerata]|uniref:Rhodanese domain-containing protein n=1 Tax=Didymella glomerata TaxID=749621 RepID=A0A9W8WW12_9PLEO|nr:hypothetical protein N0V87_006843 [Didymella glomerata]
MPQELLIDVRSPLEFSTGPLVSDIATTVNIEYTAIDSLAEIYALQNVSLEGMAGEDRKDAKDGGAVAVKSDGKEEVRQKSLDALLAGLKECDE